MDSKDQNFVDDTAPIPRREKQIAARKDQILEAAAQVFSEKGFHRATTREIAETASIAEGTIYNYFDSKDEILIAFLARLVDNTPFYQSLFDSLAEDPRKIMQSMLAARKAFNEKNALMLRAVLSEILINRKLAERYQQQLLRPWLAHFEQHLQERVQLGQIRAIDAPLISRVFTATAIGLFIFQVLDDPLVQEDWERLTLAWSESLFNGIAPQNGGP